MTIRPADVVLNDDDRKALAILGSKQQAVQTWMQTVTQQGEARLAELHNESRAMWAKISENYKIDLKSTDYRLSEDGTRLEVAGVRFK